MTLPYSFRGSRPFLDTDQVPRCPDSLSTSAKPCSHQFPFAFHPGHAKKENAHNEHPVAATVAVLERVAAGPVVSILE